MSDWIPPDQGARDRVLDDLHTNLLVEAGAGSGKTTSMVGRMVRLILTGTAEIEEIAAVTFTRKAAAELRERFQEELESSCRKLVAAPAGTDGAVEAERGGEAERAARALEGLNRGFVGTIHSFCARLLRERPLEAGIPPDFQEVSGSDEKRLRQESWNRFRERLNTRPGGSRLRRSLQEVGLHPDQIEDLFIQLSENADVHFAAPRAGRPGPEEIARVRHDLGCLLNDSLSLFPAEAPDEPDKLQKKVKSLQFSRIFPGWERDEHFMEALETAFGSNGVTQKRWGEDRETKAAAKALGQRWESFCEEGRAHRLHIDWLAHRYPVVLRFARTAARVHEAERRRLGRLNFQDLLMLTAALLRDDPDARRELGSRYRYLLVDEFQDTDPIQAELLFLLASDGEPATESDPAAEGSGTGRASSGDWSRLQPRPGALFLVGDPKQSIYRFRRADISLYSQVKRRFREFGEVLELTSNFRSTAPIGAFVERVFDGPFPVEQTLHQAAFAPLNVSPLRGEHEGVYGYGFTPPDGRLGATRIAELEAPLIASWIAERIERDGRVPSDFMILTHRKNVLSEYGHALESRGIPFQLSGSGVGVREELKELILLLRALGDPDNAVLTVAVLEGLFFGLSHDELHRHVAAGGDFGYMARRDGEAGIDTVRKALGVLRKFWWMGRRAPADVVVAEIVAELGILPHAAAGELGSTRAAALLYALDALRVAGMDGKTSLAEAVEVLEIALDEEVDAPLDPGESNAVRIMNLHKAKGLEAKVVILANPWRGNDHRIDRHISRDARGRAIGHLLVTDGSRMGKAVIARPHDWEEHEAAEAPFAEAETERLMYVAATRAGHELVIGRCTGKEDNSAWDLFNSTLDNPDFATPLEIRLAELSPRRELEESGEEITRKIAAVTERRKDLGRPSYRPAAVTTRVKGWLPDAGAGVSAAELAAAAGPTVGPTVGLTMGPDVAAAAGPTVVPDPAPAGAPPRTGSGSSAAPGGAQWGSAVHAALEFVGRGATGPDLRRACRDILVEAERPLDAKGEPVELALLLELIEKVTQSRIWQRAARAERLLVEMPFSVSFTGEDYRALGIEPDRPETEGRQIVEGKIDLAFREPQGWVIVDYKTDRSIPEDLPGHPYARQLELYAACLARVTGEPVHERILFFIAKGEEVAVAVCSR